MYHAGLGTREYYEECVARTVRTVKRAARKKGNDELKNGTKPRSENNAKKTTTTKKTSPPPESVEVRPPQAENARKTPKTAPKSVKIR